MTTDCGMAAMLTDWYGKSDSVSQYFSKIVLSFATARLRTYFHVLLP